MSNPQPKLAIVIQTKNNIESLSNCISTIRFKSKYKNYKVYIADTGSTDQDLKVIRENISNIFHVTKNCKLIQYNYWHYGKINNNVVKNYVDSDTDIVLFCNDDIELVNDAISYMVRLYTMHKDEIGTFSPRLTFENGAIQHAGYLLYAFKHDKNKISTISVAQRGYNSMQRYLADGPEEIAANTGAFCMIPYKLFQDIGGFNENYSYCLDDIELSLECIKRGKKNYYLDYATCIHYEEVTKMKELDMEQEPIRYNHDFNNNLQPYIHNNANIIKKYISILSEGEKL